MPPEQSFKETFLVKTTVFTAGAVVMCLEIFGFGIIAPYFGKSLIVSSVLVGVVFLSLSVGYFIGGFIADHRIAKISPDKNTLAKILLAAGIFIGIGFLFRDFAGSYLRWNVSAIASGTLFFTIPFFAPINILLGAVLPIAIRIINGVKTGRLYSLSTIGSIAGTLVAGYILVPYGNIGFSMAAMAAILIILAVFLFPRLRLSLLLVPILFSFENTSAKMSYLPPSGAHRVSDGSIIIDPAKMKKLDEAFNQYGLTEVYETIDEASGKTIRLFRVNRELHSVSFLDSDELVLNYAKYNRLGGHFNPDAKKALLLGGGGYSYAKYFLGDTPLFDKEKRWMLDGKKYGNIGTVTVPVLVTNNSVKFAKDAVMMFAAATTGRESQKEGEKNKIIAHNQHPGKEAVAAHVEMNNTGMFDNEGFVHVHEVSKDGTPGKIVSVDVPIVPHEIIGHSELFTGTRNNIRVPLDRKSKDGETLYLMLHRDNGNKRFDQLLVDGYEQIEQLDVVEIDPNATKFAEKYFFLKKNDPRLRIFEEDGRTYLNRTKEKYDIIYIDAFQSFYSIPFQLVTVEAYQKVFDSLNDNGVVVANFPDTIGGKFFQSEWQTIKKVFPVVRVYAVDAPNDPDTVQNIVVVAFKNAHNIRTTPNFDDEINKALTHEWKGEPDPNALIFTDDYAPTEYLIKDFIDIPTM